MGQNKMKYGSVCSGIEAASVAWESLGWEAQWYSEIEPFPSAVLAHRFPTVEQCPDGPRYKACGNSMAVPVMRWIGQRIEMVEKLISNQ
jgi:site-specific DNA-cytosine methylase